MLTQILDSPTMADDPSPDDAADTKAAVLTTPEEQEMEQMRQSLMNDESCQGPIGLALRTALDSITTATASQNNNTEPLFTADQRDRIMQAFGAAIVATTGNGDATTTALVTPPAATLKGRLEYANRYGDKWRMVVDQASVTPQQQTDDHQIPSAANITPTACPPSIAIPRLEILAFNDFD